MSDTVIQVERLGKKYRIRHQAERARYRTLRDVMAQKAGSVVRGPWSVMRRIWALAGKQKADPPSSDYGVAESRKQKSVEDFWALKDVSFEVKQGETLGIIGRNGAGKSTLLKILSRITEPTEGRVRIKGRVASLLEVGTGFHPELTGRENIFLNGAILGMSRAEIKSKFDEIVAFAEVEKFLDTPVKHYSSGMYVRLAFAVAAHLEPDILIVDEVLAVGDAEFQKKSLGKMHDIVGKRGRTILFVSHNMGAINSLCENCIHLGHGQIADWGATRRVVTRYLSMSNDPGSHSQVEWSASEAPGIESLKILSVSIEQGGSATSVVDIAKSFVIVIVTQRTSESARVVMGVHIRDEAGQIVLLLADAFAKHEQNARPGILRCSIELPAYLLNIGCYNLSLSADIPNVKVLFTLPNVIRWTAESSCEVMGRYGPEAWHAVIGPGVGTWRVEHIESRESSKQ